MFFSEKGLLSKRANNLSTYNWPHSDIMNEIKNENNNLISTLAILPDTKEINTFNLEAEASKEGEYVAVRQVISNKETYKDYLKFFDWFLVKTGDQGVMFNESKNLLNQYLLNSSSFKIHKEWNLPDKSKLLLLRRNSLNTYLVKNDCNNIQPNLNITKIPQGIRLNLMAQGKLIRNSKILVDFNSDNFKTSANFSLANGSFHRDFNEEDCYLLTQEIIINLPENNLKDLNLKTRILDENGQIKNLKFLDNYFTIEDGLEDENLIKMANKISEVELLGNFLRRGEFKKLFNLVGVINQSDPNQIYLKDSEKIYSQRYIENRNIKDLYNVLICQILERKIVSAEETINLILKYEKFNGNAQIAKAIINIYLIDKKDARISLNKAKTLEKSEESREFMKIIEGLTYLLEFKFINAYRLLT